MLFDAFAILVMGSLLLMPTLELPPGPMKRPTGVAELSAPPDRDLARASVDVKARPVGLIGQLLVIDHQWPCKAVSLPETQLDPCQ